jgi:hypothetical protein
VATHAREWFEQHLRPAAQELARTSR